VAALVALFGPKRGVRLDLVGDVVLGRSSSATLQLIDGKVSREHCRLVAEGGRAFIEDLGSHNGTFVNGERITGRHTLAPGDEIAIGDSLFLIDPDLAVLAARFGDATLVVSNTAAPAGVRPLASAVGSEEPVAALAVALGRASGAEAGAAALLAAVEARFGPARSYVLLGDGTTVGLRVLLGSPTAVPASPPAATPILPRATLAEAARQRRAVVTLAPVEERTHAGVRGSAGDVPRAIVVVPLVVPAPAGAQVAGFLYVDREASRPFSDDDATALETFGALAALHTLGGALASSASARTAAEDAGPVGPSPGFARVRKLAAAAARTTSTVLITGESGTGKEEIARAIHRASGRGAFVAVNCGAIPEALAESELFGHERGAFTGAVAAREGRVEAADGGTLFLDEVGELVPALQVKLLRVLQERVFHRVGSATPRSVDLRVIAATHRNLERDIEAGRFREDLFYRLNVVRIEIPPLRDRPEDVAPLAAALLARIAGALGRPVPGLDVAAQAVLARGRWPGNARQLGNVLERALVLRDEHVPARAPLTADEIVEALGGIDFAPVPAVAGASAAPGASRADGAAGPEAASGDGPALPEKVAALERAEILSALRASRGVKARAARALGISRPTLDKKIADLAIDVWADGAGGRP